MCTENCFLNWFYISPLLIIMLMTTIIPYWAWCSHNSDYEKFLLCDVMPCSESQARFQENAMLLFAVHRFLAWLILWTWRRKQNVPPKYWFTSTCLHSVTSQMTEFFTIICSLYSPVPHNFSVLWDGSNNFSAFNSFFCNSWNKASFCSCLRDGSLKARKLRTYSVRVSCTHLPKQECWTHMA